MLRTVVVGLDGWSESRTAAEWAAREAELRGLPLKLVNVWGPAPGPTAKAPHWMDRIPREAADSIRLRHPGLDVTTEQVSGSPGEALLDAANDAELLVLGSRGLGSLSGFLLGSVGLTVVAQAERPVVLVRAGEQAADESVTDPSGVPSAEDPYRPVVLGLDADSPGDEVIEFAFDAAARRRTSLHVVYGWHLPLYYSYAMTPEPGMYEERARVRAGALADVVRPWRRKFSNIDVVEQSRSVGAAHQLIEAAAEASLVVVGRRIRSGALGTRIGPVTHAVLHHATTPVAVIAHG